MRDREQKYVALRAALTEMGPVALAGTGQVAAYLTDPDGLLLPAGLLDDMLARLDEPLARPEEEAADAPRAFDHLITQMRA